jgi:1-acyl-sn-glycerol-3-phosphate acyltransferase
MELINPLANFLQGILLRTFADWQVTGRENVPPMGPLIVVANHQSNVDPTLISTSIPRRTWFLAKKGVFSGPLASWFLRSYGAFPLDRGRADIRAYRWTLEKLERDQAVVLFPEGTRGSGGMQKALPGVARLALRSQAPLLPVGITGTERLGTVFRVLNPTGKIRVNIGSVFSLPSIEGRLGREVVESLTDTIMQRIAALLPASYQGVYAISGRRGAGHRPYDRADSSM